MTASRPDYFTCAATLTAYVEAVQQGRIAHDRELYPLAAGAIMFHLNAWAMPQELREAEAFEKVRAEGARIRDALGEEELIKQVRWCVDNRPSFGR